MGVLLVILKGLKFVRCWLILLIIFLFCVVNFMKVWGVVVFW